MIRRIVLFPDAVLTQTAEPYDLSIAQMLEICQDLKDTLKEYTGHGLAAPQIGISKRIILVNTGDNVPVILIRPSWVPVLNSIEETQLEGCLSLPGVMIKVKRYQQIGVTAISESGAFMSFVAKGMEARIIQHECDHLEGKLIIDHEGKLSRSRHIEGFMKEKKSTRRMVRARRKEMRP